MKVCMDKKLKRTPTLIIVRGLADRALVPVAKVFQLSIAVESVYTQHMSSSVHVISACYEAVG